MIGIRGTEFVDLTGRSLMLRGFNIPARRPSECADFYDGTDVSFVGRPWPLEVADAHAANLKKLGMNWVRISIPWEAVMHPGPDQFDEEYLTYLERLISIFQKYQIFVDIDPHQDVFSRFSGGSGAPKWTFEHAGLIPENFYDTLAATTDYEYKRREGRPFPYLFWITNNSKLACMTMFTLFWAGDTYAPKLPIQTFLQKQYLNFIKSVVERIRHHNNILGISTMNEISTGYIGNRQLNQIPGTLKLGPMPSPLEGFSLADGQTLSLPNYSLSILGFHKKGYNQANPHHLRVWRKNCIWKDHGVWDYNEKGQAVILKPNHFQLPNQDTFANHFYTPFAKKITSEVRKIREKTHIILQTSEFIEPPRWNPKLDGSDVIYDCHFYDPIVFVFKWYQNLFNAYEVSHKLVFFKYFIDRAVRRQMSNLKQTVKNHLGKIPLLLGETGFVMDIYAGLFFKRSATKTNNYKYVRMAADRVFKGIEANLMNVAIWNYDIFNTIESGDHWNKENFSVYCSSLENPLRGYEGWLRPYAVKTPGKAESMSYNRKKRRFRFRFKHDQKITAPLEIFIPAYLEENGYTVSHSSGSIQQTKQMLLFFPTRTTAWIEILFNVSRPR